MGSCREAVPVANHVAAATVSQHVVYLSACPGPVGGCLDVQIRSHQRDEHHVGCGQLQLCGNSKTITER